MNPVGLFFFDIFPYICIASFVLGSIWRYRYDQMGWTSYSTQLYESKTLRWASPMWHFGLLGVLLGHVGGLLIPESWTNALGIQEKSYHLVSLILGGVFGIVMLIGLIGLLSRRLSVKSVRLASLRSDAVMYPVLIVVVVLGLINTLYFQTTYDGGQGYDYRTTVSEWFRSIFYLNPAGADRIIGVNGVAGAPWSFQLHSIFAFLLIGIWPYTRLVHMFSVPVGYLTRPYVVYRSRKPEADAVGRDPRPGWERPSLEKTRR